MEHDERNIAERLEAATALLERALTWIEERQTALSGDVEKISATVEIAAATRREAELAEKLAVAEKELAELKAAAAQPALRRTVPSTTSEMLAKHGIGDGPVDVRTLDTALTGLSLEQRIAVKSQLLRAGQIAQ